MKIKILILTTLYPRTPDLQNGIFVHQQIKELKENGVEVQVICPVPYSPRFIHTNKRRKQYAQVPEQDFIDGILVKYPRYLRIPGKWFHSISSFTMYCAIKKLVKTSITTFKPNILHSFTSTPAGYTGLLLKKKYNLLYICSLLGSDINLYITYRPFTKKLAQKVLLESNQIIAVSNKLKTSAEYIGPQKYKIDVVYMGCNTNLFQFSHEYREQIRTSIGILPKEKIILFVGGIYKAKGVLELLSAFQKLNALNDDLHLIYVGDGQLKHELYQRVKKHNLEKRVHLIEKKSHKEISKWMSACDVFTLPSYQEGLPNVVMEAMACQRVVVTTNVGGIPEAVSHGRTGILCEPENIESLLNALKYALENLEKSKTIEEQARRFVVKNFTWSKNAQDLITIYKKVLERYDSSHKKI